MSDENKKLPEPDWDDDFVDKSGDEDCPNCGKEYDEIDYDFQICHYCGFINNKDKKQ